MLAGVAGRHASSRRRVSSPMVRTFGSISINNNEDGALANDAPRYTPRRGRRAAVTTSDQKSCAVVQTRLKCGIIDVT